MGFQFKFKGNGFMPQTLFFNHYVFASLRLDAKFYPYFLRIFFNIGFTNFITKLFNLHFYCSCFASLTIYDFEKERKSFLLL